MAPHVQRVFGASPSAVGKLLFSAPSVSFVPARSWFSLSCPAGPRLLFLFSGYSRAIRTLAQPTPLLFPYSFSILEAYSVPLGHLLVRSRYPNISKSEKRMQKWKKRRRKTPGHAGVATKYEIRVCQNGGWRFSLKPMGD